MSQQPSVFYSTYYDAHLNDDFFFSIANDPYRFAQICYDNIAYGSCLKYCSVRHMDTSYGFHCHRGKNRLHIHFNRSYSNRIKLFLSPNDIEILGPLFDLNGKAILSEKYQGRFFDVRIYIKCEPLDQVLYQSIFSPKDEDVIAAHRPKTIWQRMASWF